MGPAKQEQSLARHSAPLGGHVVVRRRVSGTALHTLRERGAGWVLRFGCWTLSAIGGDGVMRCVSGSVSVRVGGPAVESGVGWGAHGVESRA